MADVLKPKAFNERFTVYLNAEGKLQRALCYMTAGEVLAAIERHKVEAERLEAVTAPFLDHDDLPLSGEVTDEERAALARRLMAEADLLQRYSAAQDRYARLVQQVCAVIPEEAREVMPMGKAVQQFWPGGRAA